MSLLDLNHDILLGICSLFKTRKSLLELALTCRTLHSVVIPAFLYERLDFPHHLDNPTSLVRFRSFVDAIRAADSVAAGAIRHIEVPDTECLHSFWVESIPSMRNLCSVTIPEWVDPFLPLILKQLSAMPHLHTLSLDVESYDCLGPLRELSGLRSLSVFLIEAAELTLDSALGVVLLNSRDTLTILSLENFEWQIPTCSAAMGELVWPNVVELDIWNNNEDSPMMDLNLTHHFPSVRQFGCTESMRWDRPFNAPFISRLLSLDAPLHLVTFAKGIGAPLRRIVVYAPDEYVELNSYLPPNIRSVTFDFGITRTVDALRQLEGLAAVFHKVTYLAVDYQLQDQLDSSDVIAKESALQSLSNLSVECLSLPWPLSKGKDLDRHEDRHSHMQEFAAAAFQLMPSLQFAALHSVYDHTTYWRRTVGAEGILSQSGFSQVSDEEGPDYLDYYEWRWRDQPEYTSELDADHP
ncbi:hypothetical protein BOTBODRAFT_191084 [Botryobasidium botryosum FD-172 SS1]|uniref:F-box domain-containing protein n=1 Tax=Botryobasidium botryosum (strain FD-172 SS1) TaxID=930990 RepID=A0A067M129_BOTB1|nr:hypothetical protein BOTBODRAFT_191084 [Botryobasidium botryosum FD-172 SS1]